MDQQGATSVTVFRAWLPDGQYRNGGRIGNDVRLASIRPGVLVIGASV
jgi:hypothetical protein